MTNSVTFPVNLGGDGSTVTDDDNASTGLGNGGHRTRFVPAMGQVVAVANVLTQRLSNQSDTSSSSIAIGIGNKTFVTAGFYEWAVGMWVTVTSAANPANYMFGQVTSWTTSTNTLIVDVDSVGGSGTLSDWTIALSAYNPVGSYLTASDIGVTVQGYDADIPTVAASQAEMEAGTESGIRSMSPLRIKQAITALAASYGLFRKVDPTVVLFSKTGNFTVSTQTGLYVEVNGAIKTIASGAVVTMPGTATAGTDYAIWVKTDGTLEATTNHTSPPTTGARKIGGFHYAPGGNSTGTSGGNTTAQINQYSFWDLKFRPACPDPRGMALIAGGFWADIYLTNTDPGTNGTSKYNVTIADGSSPPKIPTLYGGNGSTAYGSLTWFEAQEVAHAYGKRPLFQSELMAAAYGTTEGSSIGTDQGSTILNAAYTSKWGLIQATGVMWVWGQERGGAYNTSGAWQSDTGGRGQSYGAPNAAIFGGNWGEGANAGSRSSYWYNAASNSPSHIGLRCAADHLILD
jgi:hypothetical protein